MVTIADCAAHGAVSRLRWSADVDGIVQFALTHLIGRDSCVAAVGGLGLQDLMRGQSGCLYVKSSAHHCQYIIEAIKRIAPTTQFVVHGRGLNLMHLAGARKLWGGQSVPPLNRQPEHVAMWAAQQLDKLRPGWMNTHCCGFGPGGVEDWRTLRLIVAAAGYPLPTVDAPAAIDRLFAAEALNFDLDDHRPEFLHEVVKGSLLQLAGDGALPVASSSCWQWVRATNN